jgi:membrane fusion protein, hemolysin D
MTRRARLRREEIEFLPPGAEMREAPAPRSAVALGLAIIAVFAGALAWACVGTLDVIAVARGRIVPRDRIQVVQAVEAGVVRRIRVREGAAVRKGQLLVDLDPTTSDADEIRLSQEFVDAQLEAARLRALLADESRFEAPPSAGEVAIALHHRLLEDQRAEYRRRLEAAALAIQQRTASVAVAAANVERLETVVRIQTQRADAFRSLLARQFIATLQFLEVEERRVDKVQELTMERRRLEQEHAALAEARAHYGVVEAEFRSARLAELAGWESRARSLAQEVVKAVRRRAVQRIVAPAAGIIQQLSIHGVGAVVAAGQQLMIVVPTGGGLEVEAWVENRDVGFVHAGQPAELKVETFPFTRYGTVPGTVLAVSPDAVTQENAALVYAARVELARDAIEVDGKTVKLAPGMAVAAEIQLGRRRVIEFFLSPLLKQTYEALRER